MRVIRLDAIQWKSEDDFYNAILGALEAPAWHGRNVSALTDSISGGGINGIEPPYKIWIAGAKGLPTEIRQKIDWLVEDVGSRQGGERDIVFQVDP